MKGFVITTKDEMRVQEFSEPAHKSIGEAHFRATGSDESPGLKNGISYKELMEGGET